MAKIILRPGIPPMGTPEFERWLNEYHAEHNTTEKMRERAEAAERDAIRITQKGREAIRKNKR